jgi:hypothetical protein
VVGLPWDRRIVLLIALAVAGLLLKVLTHGNHCLVPSPFLKPGEVGMAEVSVYGVALYRESGIDQETMYRQALWWYEMALLGEWVAAITVGATVYLDLRVKWRRRQGRKAEQGFARRPNW